MFTCWEALIWIIIAFQLKVFQDYLLITFLLILCVTIIIYMVSRYTVSVCKCLFSRVFILFQGCVISWANTFVCLTMVMLIFLFLMMQVSFITCFFISSSWLISLVYYSRWKLELFYEVSHEGIMTALLV